jgi:membrane protein DedA with SNARE-associated domain
MLKHAYARHGASIVFTARHVFGVRSAAFLIAGVVRLPFWRFLLVDTAAASLSVPLSFGLAYLFADRVLAILRGVHRVEHWLLFVAAVIATGWLLWRARRQAQGLAMAASAEPAGARTESG